MSFTVNLSGGGLLINRFNSSNMLKSTQETSANYYTPDLLPQFHSHNYETFPAFQRFLPNCQPFGFSNFLFVLQKKPPYYPVPAVKAAASKEEKKVVVDIQ